MSIKPLFRPIDKSIKSNTPKLQAGTMSHNQQLKTHLDIGILIFPNFQILDAMGPNSVFEVANAFAGVSQNNKNKKMAYRLHMVSQQGGLVKSSSGVEIKTQQLKATDSFDTLILSGGQGTREAVDNKKLIRCIQQVAPNCRRIASICTGTFILGQTGLANERQVTTHWRASRTLAKTFPSLDVISNKIWIRDGNVWSSGGVTAGIDLALAFVTDDFSAEIAKLVAREILVYYQRPGGQSQFSTVEDLCGSEDKFRTLIGWIRNNLQKTLTVETLAEKAAMSPRNFARQFKLAIGKTPAKVVEQIRVEEAKRLVESSSLPMEKIANQCGFSDSEIMRRAFVRIFGCAPRTLRTNKVSLN